MFTTSVLHVMHMGGSLEGELGPKCMDYVFGPQPFSIILPGLEETRARVKALFIFLEATPLSF
jgi:hypothetical protein